MLYKQPTFTCPSSYPGTSQQQWDLATMTKAEFKRKYKVSEAEYRRLQNGDTEGD